MRRAGRRVPVVRLRRQAGADGAAPRCGPRPAGEPLRRRRHARPLRPRPRDGRGSVREPGRGDGAPGRRDARATGRPGFGGTNPALPVLGRLRTGGRPREAPHSGGRRVPDRALAAGRAADVGERARPLPLAPPGQSLAVPLPPGAGRAGADRLLTGDAREGRGPRRLAQPDRWDDSARRRRRRAAAGLREGSRGARDARRPWPERPLARLHAGIGPRPAVPRARALLARDAPRLRGRRAAAATTSTTSTCSGPASRPAPCPARRRSGRCS